MGSVEFVLYGTCWAMLGGYCVATLICMAFPGCITTSVSFLFACGLYCDLMAFNIAFFAPSFCAHVREIDFCADSVSGFLKAIFNSNAAWDLYMIIFGTLGSYLAVFNACGILDADGCWSKSAHQHKKSQEQVIRLVYRIRGWVRFDGGSASRLPSADLAKDVPDEKKIQPPCYMSFEEYVKPTGKYDPMVDYMTPADYECMERYMIPTADTEYTCPFTQYPAFTPHHI
ncbi:hypothetical protein F4802DRAFT_46781 [Xylaria palmicola]|nr:hypothetical protein F4802DRAFT_46781 [Xylaria palmicola]